MKWLDIDQQNESYRYSIFVVKNVILLGLIFPAIISPFVV